MYACVHVSVTFPLTHACVPRFAVCGIINLLAYVNTCCVGRGARGDVCLWEGELGETCMGEGELGERGVCGKGS